MDESKSDGKNIYLSGKITGDPDFREKFKKKAEELTKQGWRVYNPAVHPDMFTWEHFMELDLLALSKCDAIYLLDDWKDSRGAKVELAEAKRLGKRIIYGERARSETPEEDPGWTLNLVEEGGVKAEVVEYKSWRWRVSLGDGTVSPWQHSDWNARPTAEDFAKAKEYYLERKAKGQDASTPDPEEVYERFSKSLYSATEGKAERVRPVTGGLFKLLGKEDRDALNEAFQRRGGESVESVYRVLEKEMERMRLDAERSRDRARKELNLSRRERALKDNVDIGERK